TFSEKNLQDEHCGSPYSITVTGALESPSTWPLCGMPLSSELTCETPATFEGGLEPPSPPPDWLITISPPITATAPHPASVRYWTRRLRASAAPASWDSAACRSVRRRSRSSCLPSMRGLYLRCAEVLPRVGEGAGRGHRQGERHQHRAGDAPLADRVDD